MIANLVGDRYFEYLAPEEELNIFKYIGGGDLYPIRTLPAGIFVPDFAFTQGRLRGEGLPASIRRHTVARWVSGCERDGKRERRKRGREKKKPKERQSQIHTEGPKRERHNET